MSRYNFPTIIRKCGDCGNEFLIDYTRSFDCPICFFRNDVHCYVKSLNLLPPKLYNVNHSRDKLGYVRKKCLNCGVHAIRLMYESWFKLNELIVCFACEIKASRLLEIYNKHEDSVIDKNYIHIISGRKKMQKFRRTMQCKGCDYTLDDIEENDFTKEITFKYSRFDFTRPEYVTLMSSKCYLICSNCKHKHDMSVSFMYQYMNIYTDEQKLFNKCLLEIKYSPNNPLIRKWLGTLPTID